MFLCLFYLVCMEKPPTFATLLERSTDTKTAEFTTDFSEKKINKSFGGSIKSSIFVALSLNKKPSLRSPRLFFRKRLLNEANKSVL